MQLHFCNDQPRAIGISNISYYMCDQFITLNIQKRIGMTHACLNCLFSVSKNNNRVRFSNLMEVRHLSGKLSEFIFFNTNKNIMRRTISARIHNLKILPIICGIGFL